MSSPRMRPPSVDALARSLEEHSSLPQPLLVEAAREAIALGGSPEEIQEAAQRLAQQAENRLLHPVINATGVLLHTNLGRAPWPAEHAAAYSNIEFDLEAGERGSRQQTVGRLFAKLCDAERAIVVNNGAAAMMLVLAALASGRGVAVGRGELVEIGGGFRVPEVMEQSGAKLVEVGTTNRTRLGDYEAALARPSADIVLCLKVHQSNYTISGFTELVEVDEMATLGVPVVYDIGSGLLDARCPWLADGPPPWLADEPAARQSLEAGADLAVFSGDKLMGGPQAGIICGRGDLIERCARHPLARALRPGGHVLSALQDVAMAYLRRDGQSIPFWEMATKPVSELRARAEAVGNASGVRASGARVSGAHVQVAEMSSVPGGGTLPGVEIPSAGIVLAGDRGEELRRRVPAVIARVSQDQTFLDFRTIFPEQDAVVAEAVRGLA